MLSASSFAYQLIAQASHTGRLQCEELEEVVADMEHQVQSANCELRCRAEACVELASALNQTEDAAESAWHLANVAQVAESRCAEIEMAAQDAEHALQIKLRDRAEACSQLLGELSDASRERRHLRDELVVMTDAFQKCRAEAVEAERWSEVVAKVALEGNQSASVPGEALQRASQAWVHRTIRNLIIGHRMHTLNACLNVWRQECYDHGAERRLSFASEEVIALSEEAAAPLRCRRLSLELKRKSTQPMRRLAIGRRFSASSSS